MWVPPNHFRGWSVGGGKLIFSRLAHPTLKPKFLDTIPFTSPFTILMSVTGKYVVGVPSWFVVSTSQNF